MIKTNMVIRKSKIYPKLYITKTVENVYFLFFNDKALNNSLQYDNISNHFNIIEDDLKDELRDNS